MIPPTEHSPDLLDAALVLAAIYAPTVAAAIAIARNPKAILGALLRLRLRLKRKPSAKAKPKGAPRGALVGRIFRKPTYSEPVLRTSDGTIYTGTVYPDGTGNLYGILPNGRFVILTTETSNTTPASK